MNELNPLYQDNTRDERKHHAQRSKGAWHLQTGVKLWQVDPETELPEEVKANTAMQIEKVLGERDGQKLTVKQTALKVEMNPMFFYCKAINKKNALRKYHKSKFYEQIRRRKQAASNPS
jgi:hypothetical protein